MQEEQPTKRGPGRPHKAHKEAKQDIHLWLPDALLKEIDAHRGGLDRTTWIIQVIRKEIASR